MLILAILLHPPPAHVNIKSPVGVVEGSKVAVVCVGETVESEIVLVVVDMMVEVDMMVVVVVVVILVVEVISFMLQ